MEASLKEKLRVSSDSAKKVAEDLASKAEKAKDMLQIAQQKKSQEMNQANKFLQETRAKRAIVSENSKLKMKK